MSDDTRPQARRFTHPIALEQRMLLDAAAARTVADVTADHPHVADHGPGHDVLAGVTDVSRNTSQARVAVFIDTSIENYQQLLQNISASAEVFFIDPSKDGLTQMLDSLAGPHQYQSIQIYSHGADGILQLGSSSIDIDVLNARGDDLAALGRHVTGQGDVMLFGCNIAADATGKQFVDRFAQLTGADVAASDGVTGSPVVHGDWNLEYSTGRIGVQSVIDQRVQDVFASSLALGWTNLGGGTQQNIDNVNNDEYGWSLATADTTGWIVTGGYAQGTIYAYRPTGAGDYKEYPINPPTVGTTGSSVDVDGNFLIVGYPGNTVNAVYIYGYNAGTDAWTLLKTVTGTGNFGADVAIQQNGTTIRAAVGASAGQGSVTTMYSTDSGVTWTVGTAFTTNDGYNDASLAFGTSVAIDGNHLVVGAPGWGYRTSSYTALGGSSQVQSNVGRAYVYDWSGAVNLAPALGGMNAILQPDGTGLGASYNAASDDNWNRVGGGWNFGTSVDISDNGTNAGIIVGSPNEGNGEVYVWSNTSAGTGATWTYRQDIFPGGPNFGRSVGIDAYSNRIVVGAYSYDNTSLTGGTGTEDGRVWEYTFTDTTFATVAAGEPVAFESNETNSRFGWSVAIMKDIVVGGSPWFSTDAATLTKNGFLTLVINNTALTTTADTVSTTESAPITIDVRANDGDSNNINLDVSSIIAITDPTKGNVSIVNNKIYYDPAGDYEYLYTGQVASQVLTYTVIDGGGEIATGTLTINITGQNDSVQLVSPTPVTTQVMNAGQIQTLFTASNPMSSQTLAQLGYYVDVDVDTTAPTFTFAGGTATSLAVTGSLGHSLTFTINSTTGAISTTSAPTTAMVGETFNIPGIRVNDNRANADGSTSVVDEPGFAVTIARANTAPTATGGTLSLTAWEDNLALATYSQSANTITVTLASHGLAIGDTVSLDFTSGAAADATYTVTGVTTNTFTVTDAVSRTTSGNVTTGRTQVSMVSQFSDTDPGEVLTYTLVGAPTWVTVGPSSGQLQFFGTNSDVTGTASTFTVRATDQYGLVANKTVTLSLLPVNDAPLVTNDTPETQAYINTTYNDVAGQALLDLSTLAPTLFTDIDKPTANTFTLSATYADGVALGTVGHAGAWLRFDAATGRFYSSGAVTGDAIGTVVSVTLTATDNGTPPLSTTYTFDISVFAAPGSAGYVSGTSPSGNNQAGYAVAVSEDGLWMAVGEPRYDAGGNDNYQGRVSIYSWNGTGWVAAGTLVDPSPASGERFGYALDFNSDGTRLVVGAPGTTVNDSGAVARANAGAVYAFSRTAGAASFTTTPTATYTQATTDVNTDDSFGYAVAMNRAGTMFVAGAPGDTAGAGGAGTSGAVYLFTFQTTAGTYTNGIKQTSVLDTGETAASTWIDRFGSSVDFDGNLVVVGSPFDSTKDAGGTGTNQLYFNGSATMFGVDAAGFGNYVKKTGAASYDLFGWDVALDSYRVSTAVTASDTSVMLAVGAPGSDLKYQDAGAVYTYRLEQTAAGAAALTKTSTLTSLAAFSTDTAYDGHAFEHFGISVALDVGNTAANFATDTKDNGVRMVVGSNLDGTNQGNAYVYRALAAGGWVGQKYLQSNSGITTTPAENQYGWSVAITNAPTSAANAAYVIGTGNIARIVVGAPNTDQSGVGPKGAVYTATTSGSQIESASGLYSGNVDKSLGGGAPVADVHLLPKRFEWQPGALLSAYVEKDDEVPAPVGQFMAGDADLDSLLMLLASAGNPAAAADAPATDHPADGKAAGQEKAAKPAAGEKAAPGTGKAGGGDKPAARPAAEPAVGAALSRQMEHLGTRHAAQAKDFIGRLASLAG